MNMKKNDEPVAILVVDDSEESLHVLVTIIDEEGYEARPVTRGRQAINAARLSPPAIILLDIGLPDIDGYQVCAELKADERTRNIPILFISGLHATEDKVRALAVGGVDYVTKPFQIEEIKARINTHLAFRHMQKDLQKQNSQLKREIARRETAEKELQRAHDELELRINERTAELKRANERLRSEVTLRTEAEKRLQELLEMSSTIIQHIPSGLLVFQYQAPKELFLLNANLEARRLTGITLEGWRGQEIDEVWPNARRQGLTQAFLNTVSTGEIFKATDAVFKKGTTQRNFEVCAFRMPGHLLGLSFQDLTELTATKGGTLPEARTFEGEAVEIRDGGIREPRLSILLIAAADMQAKILAKALSKHGHTASIVPSLDEALEALSRERFSAVVCDLERADGNLLQVSKTVTGFCERAGIQKPPLVLMTPSGHGEGITDVREGDAIAQKPVHVMRLLDLIGKAVERSTKRES